MLSFAFFYTWRIFNLRIRVLVSNLIVYGLIKIMRGVFRSHAHAIRLNNIINIDIEIIRILLISQCLNILDSISSMTIWTNRGRQNSLLSIKLLL